MKGDFRRDTKAWKIGKDWATCIAKLKVTFSWQDGNCEDNRSTHVTDSVPTHGVSFLEPHNVGENIGLTIIRFILQRKFSI